jgi:hypothetical protein
LVFACTTESIVGPKNSLLARVIDVGVSVDERRDRLVRDALDPFEQRRAPTLGLRVETTTPVVVTKIATLPPLKVEESGRRAGHECTGCLSPSPASRRRSAGRREAGAPEIRPRRFEGADAEEQSEKPPIVSCQMPPPFVRQTMRLTRKGPQRSRQSVRRLTEYIRRLPDFNVEVEGKKGRTILRRGAYAGAQGWLAADVSQTRCEMRNVRQSCSRRQCFVAAARW